LHLAPFGQVIVLDLIARCPSSVRGKTDPELVAALHETIEAKMRQLHQHHPLAPQGLSQGEQHGPVSGTSGSPVR
jgi:hypothetical protein